MHIFAQQGPTLGFVTLVFFAFGACLVAWAAIIERLVSGKPVLPYQPRRRVPWRFGICWQWVFLYCRSSCLNSSGPIFLSAGHKRIFRNTARADQYRSSDRSIAGGEELDGNYFMRHGRGYGGADNRGDVFPRIVAGMAGKDRPHLAAAFADVKAMDAPGAMPIFISSLIFAGQHFREEAPKENVDFFMLLFSCDSIVRILL